MEAKEKNETQEDFDNRRYLIGLITELKPQCSPRDIAKVIIDTGKKYTGKVQFSEFKDNCILTYIKENTFSRGILGDIDYATSYLASIGILHTEGGNVNFPLDFKEVKESIGKIKYLEEIINEVNTTHSPYELAETVYHTSKEYFGNVALHEFASKCVDNHQAKKGNTTNFFYDIVEVVKYLRKKEVIEADNGHIILPFKYKQEEKK